MSGDNPRPSLGAPGLSSNSSFNRQGSVNRAAGRDREARSSHTGQPGYKPRNSMQQLPGGPRLSMSGSLRKGHRQSARGSQRSQMGQVEGGQQLQVLDEDGVDRTPKPLMSLRPTVLKGLPGVADDQGSAGSESSDFFLDRMSSAGFSRAGWYSSNNSGMTSPRSEAGDDEDYAAQREKAKAQAVAAAAELAAEEAAAEAAAELAKSPVEVEVQHPETLAEHDLERTVYITLQETQTDFILSIPCVTVAVDSEEAKVVEEANRRYASLLAAKQATDKYTEQETQTLDLLKKSREVQSAVLQTSTASCQAAAWDIADTYRALEAEHVDGEEGAAGVGPNSHLPSVNQLAGAVAKGEAYAAGGSGTAASGSRMGQSSASFMQTGPGGSFMRSESMSMAARESTVPGMSWAGNSYNQVVPGMVPGSDPNNNLPPGEPVEGGAVAPPDPLIGLNGLLETLTLMDAAITQNIYMPKLLQYRNIAQQSQQVPSTPPALRAAVVEATSRAMSASASRAVSRVPSRQHSEIGSVNGDALSARNAPTSAAGGPPVMQSMYAPSMAESHWPEELLQDLADLGPDGVPRMELLWEWTCPLTQDKNVACMAWNRARPDLLAVGYGNHTFQDGVDHSVAVKGLVAFWSLKNPEFPLWWFETRSGVTALDFASQSPNILAVGLYDGSVAIYDVKSRQGTASMESDASTGRHSDPVWKVKWLDRGPERDEPLVSISTDGRVTQWSIAKGLEFTDLMKLKRVPRKNMTGPPAGSSSATPGGATKAPSASAAAAAAANSEHDAFISRMTSGMSFDFSARDERIYIAGTEDGWIHKCSTSYSEQYLESYQGHIGPVYNVQWSPFRSDMFLSCSGDWTLRLWQEGRESALLMFQSGSHEVNDVQWCPTNSTVFGSVTSGGRLEIWDFDLSTVKPVVTHKAGIKLCCLLFSPSSPVVVCGGENGTVSVFRLFNIDREYDTAEEQLSRLEEVIRANVMKRNVAQGQANL